MKRITIMIMICLCISAQFAYSAQKSTVEFGELVKEILVNVGNEKINASASYMSSWEQFEKSKSYKFEKKEFAEEYQGAVKPVLVFNNKPAKEAYKSNVNAKWNMSATGSRAGVSKVVFSSTVNDGADEEEIVVSLKKSGITASKLTCDENNDDISAYQSGIMFNVYKLTAKGYASGILIIAGDVAAQHITLDLTVIPNTSAFRTACR